MLMRKRAGQAFDAVDRTDLFEKEYWYRCICVDRRVSQNAWRWYGYAEKTGWTSKRWLVLYRVSEKWLSITNFQEFLDNRIVKKYPKKEKIRSSMDESAVKKECKAIDEWVAIWLWPINKDTQRSIVWYIAWTQEAFTDVWKWLILSRDPSYNRLSYKQPRYKRIRHALVR